MSFTLNMQLAASCHKQSKKKGLVVCYFEPVVMIFL